MPVHTLFFSIAAATMCALPLSVGANGVREAANSEALIPATPSTTAPPITRASPIVTLTSGGWTYVGPCTGQGATINNGILTLPEWPAQTICPGPNGFSTQWATLVLNDPTAPPTDHHTKPTASTTPVTTRKKSSESSESRKTVSPTVVQTAKSDSTAPSAIDVTAQTTQSLSQNRNFTVATTERPSTTGSVDTTERPDATGDTDGQAILDSGAGEISSGQWTAMAVLMTSLYLALAVV